MNRRTLYLSLLAFAVLFCLPSSAQDETPTKVTNQNRTGDLPFSSSIGSEIEQVDIATGNLRLTIPITSLKGRGLDFNFALQYNAAYWQISQRNYGYGDVRFWNVERRNYLLTDGLGWQANTSGMTFTHTTGSACQNVMEEPGHIISFSAYIYTDSSGGKHPLGVHAESGLCPNVGGYAAEVTSAPDRSNAGIWSSVMASGQFAKVLLSDGTGDGITSSSYESPQPGQTDNFGVFGQYKDVDGNWQNQFANGVDTLGRNVAQQTSTANQIQYKVYDSNGVLRTYAVNHSAISVATGFGMSGVAEYSGTRRVINSVVLPNGRAYTFYYEPNVYGAINRIDLPNGAIIRYTWATFVPGSGEHRRHITSRSVEVNGETHTWYFTRTCLGSYPCSDKEKVTVTDPANNQAVYETDSGTILQADFYNGGAVGTPLRRYKIDYVGYNSETEPQKPEVPIRVTTTLENGVVAAVEYDYETFQFWDFECGDPVACSGPAGVTWLQRTTSTGNVKEIREYDWGAVPGSYGSGVKGPLLRRTVNTYLHEQTPVYKQLASGACCTNPTQAHNIGDRIAEHIVYDGAGVKVAHTKYEYDNTTAQTASGAPQHDYANFPTTRKRGHVTKVLRWRNRTEAPPAPLNEAWLTITYQYDELGNIRSITDPLGHTSSWSYQDNWANSYCLPPGGANGQAYVKTASNALGHQLELKYFPCTGLRQSRRDQNDIDNSRAGTVIAFDLLGRVTSTTDSLGGQTTNAYTDTPPVKVTATTKITATLNLVNETELDGLGRAKETRLLSDPQGTVYTRTFYDGLGRVDEVTNPYRNTGESTYGITTSVYDALGRVMKVIPPDGTASSNHVVTAYSGNTVTVTDQAGKKRKSETDALGRLTRVWEPDASGAWAYETAYKYDALDNLICVEQRGGVSGTGCDASESSDATSPWRVRRFTYNSLGQLLTAKNPESGTITYTYDNDGNLETKTSPQANQTGTATTTLKYCYDELHRLTKKFYSNVACTGTPVATYFYDQTSYNGLTITNGKGRRTGMADASGATASSFNALGGTTAERRTLNGVTKSVLYDYNLDGSLWKLTYPSGRVITYQPGSAGRPLWGKDVANSVNYVTDVLYEPHGAFSEMRHGAQPIRVKYTYNNRLQPKHIVATTGTLPTLDPNACGTPGNVLHYRYLFNETVANNGNVARVENCWTSARSQTFAYDELNRLLTAQSDGPTWGNSYVYDPWGNLTNMNQVAGKTNYQNLQAAQASLKNQLNGHCHDAAGNLLRVSTCGSADYTYDAENRMVTAAGVTYTYDGDGRRVKKSNGKLYWYAAGLDAIAESDLAGNNMEEYVFFAGKRVARRKTTGAVEYYFADHLGTSRVVTNAIGGQLDDQDFYPYGAIVPGGSSTSGQNYKFTGKERDAESGLDYFIARHYGSNWGRFLQPDEFTGGPVDAFSSSDPLPPGPLPYADITNPQSLNKYAYSYNKPVVYVDPDGHQAVMRHERHPERTPRWTLDQVQLVISIVGAVPGLGEAADALNAGISSLRGNWGDAAIDATAAATGPLGNSAAVGIRLARLTDAAADSIKVFKSFDALKSALGPAGEGKVWHHIVEQSKVGEFGAEAIHNTANVTAVPTEINQKLNAYYSSKQEFTGNKTVRDWLKGKSWKEQYEFGRKKLEDAMKGTL